MHKKEKKTSVKTIFTFPIIHLSYILNSGTLHLFGNPLIPSFSPYIRLSMTYTDTLILTFSSEIFYYHDK
jgi:hypothetical protein